MKWNQALVRCFNKDFQEKHPNYQGTICGDEFLNFSNFQIWFSKYEKMIADRSWMDLDSDVLSDGNKVYDFEHCCILPHRINTLLIYKRRNNSGNPGVFHHVDSGRWSASCYIYGKLKNIGRFDTKEKAA